MDEPSSSNNSRGRLPLLRPDDGGPPTTKIERGPRVAAPEPATITAGGIQETIKDATKPLSLEERFVDYGELARGGMAIIHAAYERSIGRTVALKVLPQAEAAKHRARDRFLAEAQITGQLEHPNIVPVHEVGQDDDGNYYFTMRLIEGQTLTEFLDDAPPSEGPVSNVVKAEEHLEASLEVFFRACDALSFAHSRGVLHRDVKPSNIMVGSHGQVYLMDWGIAFVSEKVATDTAQTMDSLEGEPARKTTTLTTFKVDDAGLVVGTYAYMSPEQARGSQDEMDARTDVFGMGAVLFRILTGRPPFLGQNAFAALEMAAKCQVPDVEPRVRGRLAKELLVVAKQALQAEKDHRFQSVAALKAAVQGVLRGRQRFPSQHFSAGQTIVNEGDVGDDAYFIRSGSCRVFRGSGEQEQTLLTLEEGDVFGETAVFTGEPRNASVQAASDVEVTVVPGRALVDALGLDSWMGAFVRSLGERFTERSQRVAELDDAVTRTQLAAQVLATLVSSSAQSAAVQDLVEHLGCEESVLDEAVAQNPMLDRQGAQVVFRPPSTA